jgi:hypothetical protein
MQWFSRRFTYLFQSTKGLILVAIALISLVTAVFGTLSGPMAEWGIRDVTIRVLGLRLVEAEREGRIILLYHTIAMAVVAIEVYIITAILPMRDYERTTINSTITFGYILSLVFGLTFGYFGHNFVFHGLFIFGQSLVFFAGLLLAAALWPWRKEYRVTDSAYAHAPGGVDLERMAFFVMAVATLGSALFGAVTGSYWGNGHETFLAEDLIREPVKSALQLAIIGHLHIMLTLIAVALALIVGRWFDFKGIWHKLSMPLMILGTAVVTLGVWAVVPFEPIAHKIIYVGSTVVLLGALFLVIFGFDKLIRDGVARMGLEKANPGDRLRALLHDPLKFGALWQMIYMNFVVSFPGIYMAVNLDEIFRVWPAREERIILTGHWHILSGLIATIILLYYADMAGLKGRARQWFGWLVIFGSDLAFGAVMLFAMKRLFVSESAQQPLVDWAILLTDVGIVVVLVVLAALMVWRLIDLFKRKGRWAAELDAVTEEKPGREVSP